MDQFGLGERTSAVGIDQQMMVLRLVAVTLRPSHALIISRVDTFVSYEMAPGSCSDLTPCLIRCKEAP